MLQNFKLQALSSAFINTLCLHILPLNMKTPSTLYKLQLQYCGEIPNTKVMSCTD